jgi:hypothetical protein
MMPEKSSAELPRRDERVLSGVRREERTIIDEHAGFFDLFVPVG